MWVAPMPHCLAGALRCAGLAYSGLQLVISCEHSLVLCLGCSELFPQLEFGFHQKEVLLLQLIHAYLHVVSMEGQCLHSVLQLLLLSVNGCGYSFLCFAGCGL